MPWGEIDEAGIAEARALIDVPLRRDRMRWVEAVSKDAVRQFALGVGDENPLWHDERYAAATRHGAIVAPPSFLYAVDSTIVAPKLPGVQWIYAGTTWTWFDTVRVGDRLTTDVRLTGVEEKQGRRYGCWVLQRGAVRYRRDDGRLVAVAEGRTARTPRRSGGGGPSRSAAKTPSRPPVGRPAPAAWEAVRVGDVVGPLAKGPLDLREVFAWYAGAQGALHYGGAHGDGVRYRRRHQDYAVNHATGAKEFAAAGHFDAGRGRDVGLGGAYDVGPQRIAWAVQLLTDWAGDDGFVHRLALDLRRPNLFGHVTTWTARVETKSRSGAGGAVGLAVQAHNQDGDVTASGTATVMLPVDGQGVQLPITCEVP